jgi:hypothetical protein
MARLAEAYALATEGMTPEQRRKLFPMDLSRGDLDNFVGPSKDAPGGTEGIMGSDVGTLYGVRAGTDKMAGTTFVDPSPLINKINNVKSLLNDPNLTFPVIPKGDGAYQSRAELQDLLEILEGRLSDTSRGEVPTSEMGLVDIGADSVNFPGGLINKDALPPEIRNTLDYPVQGPAITPASGATPQDFNYYQDNPAVDRPETGREWLEGNIRYTEERYGESDPSMLRGPTTAVLGMGRRYGQAEDVPINDMFLSTDELTELPGANFETRVTGDAQFDELLKKIKEEGWDPDQAGNKVVIGVNHMGQAYIVEGNTRAAVAKALGIPNIKTEVRYWNGGEMVDGPYKPGAVAARAVVNKAEGGVITLADVARNTGRGPRGVDSLAPIARNMYRTMVS